MTEENGISTNVPAIVLSNEAGGLGAVRSLARRGIDVIAIAYQHRDLVLHSRLPSKTYVLRGDSGGEKEAHLIEVLNGLPVPQAVILTDSDRMVSLLSRERGRLQGKFRYALPSPEILEALNDKRLETELIESLGFGVPKTVRELPPTAGGLQVMLRLPIIFKPYSYVAQQRFPAKNAVIESAEELQAFYSEWGAELGLFIAQEVIPGPDCYSWICSCTYDRNHELLDCGIKQKLRTYPAHFGGSCFAVSRSNPEILELAKRLGKKLEYVGHAGIEFRWDDRDHRYKYIEMNPRLPENVTFDEACGLPTVWNSYRVSLEGLAPKSGTQQEEGRYYWSVTHDLLSLREDRVSMPKILAALVSMLVKRTSGLYFAWDDPGPGIVVTYRFARRMGRAILKRIGLRSGGAS